MGDKRARGAARWRGARGVAVSKSEIRQRAFGRLERGAMEDDVQALDPPSAMEP